MSTPPAREKAPSLPLCFAILLGVLATVIAVNTAWRFFPQVTLHKADPATAAPWVCTACATAIPSPTPAPTDTPDPSATVPGMPSPAAPVAGVWVLNTRSKKFHLPSCSSVATIRETNRGEFTGERESLIEQGYTPCGSCKP